MLRFESQLYPMLFSGPPLNRGLERPKKCGTETTHVFFYRSLEIALKIETSQLNLMFRKREVGSHRPWPLSLRKRDRDV